MGLSAFEHLIYGFLSGLTEIFPVSARAHSTILLKVLGAEKSAVSRCCSSILLFLRLRIFPARRSL